MWKGQERYQRLFAELAEGATALSVTLSGGAVLLVANSSNSCQFDRQVILARFTRASAHYLVGLRASLG